MRVGCANMPGHKLEFTSDSLAFARTHAIHTLHSLQPPTRMETRTRKQTTRNTWTMWHVSLELMIRRRALKWMETYCDWMKGHVLQARTPGYVRLHLGNAALTTRRYSRRRRTGRCPWACVGGCQDTPHCLADTYVLKGLLPRRNPAPLPPPTLNLPPAKPLAWRPSSGEPMLGVESSMPAGHTWLVTPAEGHAAPSEGASAGVPKDSR
eukprot:363759-Chlamydomonas_euryale.AAC.10